MAHGSNFNTHIKDYFANLAVDAVLRLKVCIFITSKPFSQPWYSSQNFLLLFLYQGSGNLDHIQILKKSGGLLSESYLEDEFLLDKK
jgi:T-complex protein 1 subunit beta